MTISRRQVPASEAPTRGRWFVYKAVRPYKILDAALVVLIFGANIVHRHSLFQRRLIRHFDPVRIEAVFVVQPAISSKNCDHIYMMSVAAEDEAYVPEKAVSGLQGWVDCFEKAELVDTIFCGGINDAGEAVQHQVKLEAAYEFGRKLK